MEATQRTRATLLNRLKHGNSQSDWEEFYLQYKSVILSFCRSQGLDHQTASDVLQETMVLLIRKLPFFEYDPKRGLFRNWLFKLAAGKVRDCQRRARSSRFVPWAEASAIIERSKASDSGQAIAFETEWRLAITREALTRIQKNPRTSPETFAVFQAYAIEGCPVGEISKRFSLQPNAIYQIRNRMMKHLKSVVAVLYQSSV